MAIDVKASTTTSMSIALVDAIVAGQKFEYALRNRLRLLLLKDGATQKGTFSKG
jgi:hypothetical protein